MLKGRGRPTRPAAPAGETALPNISWIMGEAWLSTPIPAVTFMHNTPHRSQNCGVRHAMLTRTLALVTSLFGCAGGTQRSGLQSGAGTRTAEAPIIIKAKYRTPIVTKVLSTPFAVAVLNC